jgi:hypothetical protein
MKTYRLQEFVVKGKEVFVGLEDSKKTWKLAVRSERMVIHQVSMEAKYAVLIRYLRNKFPECTVHLLCCAQHRRCYGKKEIMSRCASTGVIGLPMSLCLLHIISTFTATPTTRVDLVIKVSLSFSSGRECRRAPVLCAASPGSSRRISRSI